MITLPMRKKIRLDELKKTFGLSEEWVLCAWPISYDGSVAFIFKNRHQSFDTGIEDSVIFQYKVILQKEFGSELYVLIDFSYVSRELVTLGFYQDGYIVVTRNFEDNYFAERYETATHLKISFDLGCSINRCAVTKDGHLAVGYWLIEGDDYPRVCIFDPLGQPVYVFKDEISRKCSDLTADCNGDIWFHCMPNRSIYRVSESNSVIKYELPVVGESGFALWQEDEDDTAHVSFLIWTDAEQMGVMIYYCTIDRTEKCQLDDIPLSSLECASMYGNYVIVQTTDGYLASFDLRDKIE